MVFLAYRHKQKEELPPSEKLFGQDLSAYLLRVLWTHPFSKGTMPFENLIPFDVMH